MNPNQGLDGSSQGRLNAWAFAFSLASDYPVTGGVIETFTPELFSQYAPTADDVHGPHSIYFQILGEHGFVGLFLYLAIVYSSWASASRIARRARRYDDMVAESYANMFRYSIVGFLTSGAFLGRAYFDYFFTIVACIAILARVCESRWARMIRLNLKRVRLQAIRYCRHR